jgi:hypothetical protein
VPPEKDSQAEQEPVLIARPRNVIGQNNEEGEMSGVNKLVPMFENAKMANPIAACRSDLFANARSSDPCTSTEHVDEVYTVSGIVISSHDGKHMNE